VRRLKEPEKTSCSARSFASKLTRHTAHRRACRSVHVFFHLLTLRSMRTPLKYKFTWGMGAFTLPFTVLTSRASFDVSTTRAKVQAFRDILYLENDVPFGKMRRNMHRGPALMIIAGGRNWVRVVLTGSKAPRANSTGASAVLLMVLLTLCSRHRLLFPMTQLGFWGCHRGHEHGFEATPVLGTGRPFGALRE